MDKRKLITALAVIAVLVIGGIWASKSNESKVNINESDTALFEVDGGVRVIGEISCLPYKKEKEGQGCVRGIEDDFDRFFALDSSKVKGLENTMPLGTRVVAVGEFFPADEKASESNVFDYYGVLVLKSLRKE